MRSLNKARHFRRWGIESCKVVGTAGFHPLRTFVVVDSGAAEPPCGLRIYQTIRNDERERIGRGGSALDGEAAVNRYGGTRDEIGTGASQEHRYAG